MLIALDNQARRFRNPLNKYVAAWHSRAGPADAR